MCYTIYIHTLYKLNVKMNLIHKTKGCANISITLYKNKKQIKYIIKF